MNSKYGNRIVYSKRQLSPILTVFKKQTGHFPFHGIIFDKDSAKENNDKARFLGQHLRLSHLIFIYLHAI